MAPRSAANAIVLPSGEKLGDSGSSTDFIAIRSSMSLVRTFCTMSVRSFSVRTKYAMRSPFGDHAIHGMTLVRHERENLLLLRVLCQQAPGCIVFDPKIIHA